LPASGPAGPILGANCGIQVPVLVAQGQYFPKEKKCFRYGNPDKSMTFYDTLSRFEGLSLEARIGQN